MSMNLDQSADTITPSSGTLTVAGAESISGQITSTVATGTAPFVVSSTTQVANLNVATAGTAAGLSATLVVGSGGTGATTFTANGILYGNGTSALGVTAAGTTGQILTATTGGAPTWTTPNATSPAFSAYSATTQTLTSTTTTKIAFNAKEFDTANCFDSTTNYRYTPNVAGYYQFNSSAQFAYTSTTRMRIELYKNGALYKRLTDAAVAMNSITGGSVVYMNGSTDYVEIYATILGVGTLTVNGGTADVTWFNGVLVRAA